MIQDIYPCRFNNEYRLSSPSEDDNVFVFDKRTILIKSSNKAESNSDFSLPQYKDLDIPNENDSLLYLFSIDEKPYFLYLGKEHINSDKYSYEDLYITRVITPISLAFATMSAWHLNTWYRENNYCGLCKGKRIPGKKERSLICQDCGHTTYPKIQPAVIVGVTDGDKLLMTRYAGRIHKNWALVAGFCEFGEAAEDTVKREVLEEVGLTVKNIKYFASQPWGVEQDLLLGYYCEVDKDTEVSLDRNELAEARWFNKEEIPPQENLYSLTATMIENFRTS